MDIPELHPLLQRNKMYKVFDFTGTGAIRKPRRYRCDWYNDTTMYPRMLNNIVVSSLTTEYQIT